MASGQCLLEVFFCSSFISCLLAQGVAGEDDGPEEEVSQDGEEADGQEGGAVGGGEGGGEEVAPDGGGGVLLHKVHPGAVAQGLHLHYVGPDIHQFWNFDTHPSY